MAELDEEHIVPTMSGHEESVDCWCEPTNIFVKESETDDQRLVIVHVDNHDKPDAGGMIFKRPDIIKLRTQHADWVTKLLNNY